MDILQFTKRFQFYIFSEEKFVGVFVLVLNILRRFFLLNKFFDYLIQKFFSKLAQFCEFCS